MPDVRRHGRRGAIAAVVMALLALSIALPGPALAATPRVFVVIGGCGIFTEQLPANKQIRFTLLRPNGTQKAARTVNSGGGSVEIDCLGRFAIGDKLVIRRVNGPVLRTITVPRVTITLNRATNKASGKAPAGRSATLLSGDCEPSDPLNDAFCGSGEHQKSFTIPANGSWSKSAAAPGFDPVGGDAASLFLFSPQGDRFTVSDRANVVEVQLGSARVRGIGKPGATVTVTFKDGSTVQGTGTAKANGVTGFFSLTVRKNGNAVLPEVDDEVITSVAGDASFVLTDGLEVDVSQAADDRITGTCFSNGRFEVSMLEDGGLFRTKGFADANGLLDVETFTGSSPITPGLTVQLRCLTPAGDRVLLQAVVP